MPNSKSRIDWSSIHSMLLGSNEDEREEAVQEVSRFILGLLRTRRLKLPPVPPQEREDLCNQSWVRLLQNLPLKNPKALGAFTAMAAHDVVVDWWRKEKRRRGDRPGDDPEEVERQPPNKPPDPSLSFDVHRALQMLTDEERAAVLMVRAGLPYEEGAEALGWPLIKFRRRFYSGRDKLRSLLPDYKLPGELKRKDQKKG